MAAMRGIGVLVSWSSLGFANPSENDLIDAARTLNRSDGLIVLIRLLRWCDSGKPSAPEQLDRRAGELLPTALGRRAVGALEGGRAVFFTKWQLLLAVKLVCIHGRDEPSQEGATVPPDDILRLLLVVNDFIYRDYGEAVPLDAEAEQMASIKGQLIKQSVLLSREQPRYLVGRYYDLLTIRASKSESARFNNWMDIEHLTETRYGFSLSEFQAVSLGLYSSIPEDIEAREANDEGLPFCVDPTTWFKNATVNRERVSKVLGVITCTPDEVRDEHQAKYGLGVGRVFDLIYLMRHPAMELDPACLALLSPRMVVQRYTGSYYWDLHDVLPDRGPSPNRQNFQAFFGQLMEDYGHDLLQRIASQDARRRSLIWESDYQVPGEKTTDGLLLELLGASSRCTLVEFTVGRPRLEDTVLEGDLEAFEEDLKRKLGSAVDQQIDLLRRVLRGQRVIKGLDTDNVSKWLVCVVVSDPYPSYKVLVSSLSQEIEELRQEGVDVSGVYVLSLEELELIETLTPKTRMSQLLVDWKNSAYAATPFKSFYDARISNTGAEPKNEYVLGRMDAAMNTMKAVLFPGE